MKLEIRNWKLEIGNWRRETGKRRIGEGVTLGRSDLMNEKGRWEDGEGKWKDGEWRMKSILNFVNLCVICAFVAEWFSAIIKISGLSFAKNQPQYLLIYFYFWAMENGEQKIFVWCDFTAEMDNAVLHGVTIALTLKKELCLFHHLDTKHHENIEMAEARLSGMASKIAPLLPNYPVKYIVLQTTVLDALKDLAERYECLTLVAPKTSSSKLLPQLENALFPFLFVSAKTNIPDVYKRVVVPVGYMKKSKDLALWASYLGRHNGATIDIFVAEESGTADQNTVQANLFSVQRLFGKFRFPFQVIESHSATWRLQRAALLHSLGHKQGMLMIAATFSTTFIDTLLGLTESKVIAKSGDLSVMCINSRRDFYTFCC